MIYGEKMEKTLRDEIAIAAMQGMISADTFIFPYEGMRADCELAYKIADVMLKQREVKEDGN